MSQETPIGNLNGGISDEDSKLVDSILNDLNNNSKQENNNDIPSQQNKNEITPEQMRQIQMQRQMAMQQQQLIQQQQMMAQQQQMNQQNPNIKDMGKEMEDNEDNFVEKIKKESKTIILVIFLSIIMNLEQVDGIFKTQPSLFITGEGSLNIQAIFIKSLIIGTSFYFVKTYLL